MNLTKNLFVSLLIFSLIAESQACTCKQLTIEENVSSSHVVFTAKISKIEKKTITYGYGEKESLGPSYILATLEVDESLKGGLTTGDQVIVTTLENGGACGFPFDIYHDYLIYANQTDEGLVTGLCSGSKSFSSHRRDGEIEEEIALIKALVTN